MALLILRLVFLMVASRIGYELAQTDIPTSESALLGWMSFFGVMGCAGMVIYADTQIRNKRLDIITAVYFGLIIGLFLTYVFQLALAPILPTSEELQEYVDLFPACAGVACLLLHGERAASNTRRLPLHHPVRRVPT